ncbi:family 1 glycosylhydrolase [Aureimonas leprariae]|uniref:Family 1 glycosylhydrolase n=1 Tax=Plantimonas leprariae TaxID=2615207 RepID=A0A7V7PLZ9_9HYPH|nr:family 1 glycosylhydrolase [Aureimonas leprariae]KAB0677731.1 family 1 glycosylhydrolase [Aureimonas leprariae]
MPESRSTFSHSRADFGPDFAFGVATAAHQIEGGWTDGCGASIWDPFAATPGNVRNGSTAATACDHYHRWKEDLDLVRDAGFEAYRFSFAWTLVDNFEWAEGFAPKFGLVGMDPETLDRLPKESWHAFRTMLAR